MTHAYASDSECGALWGTIGRSAYAHGGDDDASVGVGDDLAVGPSDAWQMSSPFDGDDDTVGRNDLARFAKIKQRCNAATTSSAGPATVVDDRHRVARPADALSLDRVWLAFKQSCGPSGARLCADALERFWAQWVADRTIRHTSFLSEEILLMCVPAMTAMLTAAVDLAAQRVACLEEQQGSLALYEPWAARYDALDERMQRHEAYCERIELDTWISSTEKGAALTTLLALRAEQQELDEQLRAAHQAMAPQLNAARDAHLLACRRLESHCTCRAQGRTVMQHLPSFECTVASDRSNELWRPVQAALLFCPWELETRQLHDAHKDWLASRSQVTSNVVLPEDEVSYVHQILQAAMQSTEVSHDTFVRMAAAVEKL